MKSEIKRMISNLPYDIPHSIFEIHNNNNNSLKSLHNELLLNFTCKNCDIIQNRYLYNTQFCSNTCYICYMEESNSVLEEDCREIQTDYYDKVYYKQEYKEYIKYVKQNKIYINNRRGLSDAMRCYATKQ